jgi:glycogen debranching enzyme
VTPARPVAQPGAQRTLPARPRPILPAVEPGAPAVLRHGALTLVADASGDVRPDARGLGLYHGDTRLLATLAVLLDGRRPALLGGSGATDRDLVQLTNRDPLDLPASRPAGSALPMTSLGITRHRRLGPGGLRERLRVANFTTARQTVALTLLLDSDAADIFELRGYQRPRRGMPDPIEVGPDAVRFGYLGLDGRRLRTTVAFDVAPGRIESAAAGEDASVAVVWDLVIGPGEAVEVGWRVKAAWTPRHPPGARLEARRPRQARRRPAVALQTDDALLNRVLARGLADISLLETAGPGPGEGFLAAGVPWYATLFGRDSILAALFLLPFRADLAAATLRALAGLQAMARGDDDEAEPGKIIHEFRTGEMAATGEVPFARFYGTADATPLWLLLLADHHAWTGDDGLLDDLWPNALRAVGWLEQQLAGDGLIWYRARTPHGPRNQGWKDSEDSVRDRRGTVAQPPVALIEVQAYAVGACRAVSRLADRRGDVALGIRLRRLAGDLAQRVEERFWRPELDRYAMALGGAGRAADALASNVGHALWQGALPQAGAAAAARDLAGSRLSSGWGLRTYAAGQPGYNPIGYHLGTVWPHDTAIAVAGLRRYGFDRASAVLADGLLDAARAFPLHRLPEAFCGFPREEMPDPVPYPVACAPQAWAAAAPFMVLRAMLGLEADAPARALRMVRPTLPRGVGAMSLRGLRVGDASVDVRIAARRGAPRVEVTRRRGDLTVRVTR